MSEKLRPEPAVRVRAADDVDAIYAHIQRVKREKAQQVQGSDSVAEKMAASAGPVWSVDYCGFVLPNHAASARRLAAFAKLPAGCR